MEKQEKEFYIPVDSAIADFRGHLASHDRTILSAQFGDGKSYFLTKFMQDDQVKNDYKILTLYPVNYQVAENRDVFELIKYDLLIQMLVKGVIEPEFELTNAQALALCIQMNAPSLAEALLPIMAELQLDERASKIMAGILTAKKMFTVLKKKISEIKAETRDNQILKYLNEMKKNPIIGVDVITGIIQKGIADYKKEHPEQKIVLVIEDMDRIDPAHLFRILNVFSAHIDCSYHLGQLPDGSMIGNKFGLDKVVFVMHYQKVENIFYHFYGAGADFSGYIHKFCSSNYFTYSLKEEYERYFMDRIEENTKVRKAVLSYFFASVNMNENTLRSVVSAIEQTDSFIKKRIEVQTKSDDSILLHDGILKIIAILRKLDIKDEDIKDKILDAIKDVRAIKDGVFDYLVPYMAYILHNNVYANVRIKRGSDLSTNMVGVDYFRPDGTADCGTWIDSSVNKYVDQNLTKFVDSLLDMVSM